jgi:hypothetical protein
MAKQDRLGTKKFCEAWETAGAATTKWSDFVIAFRKKAGHKNYPEANIKARIADYEGELAKVRGVHPPKYPKERTASCVAYFSGK